MKEGITVEKLLKVRSCLQENCTNTFPDIKYFIKDDKDKLYYGYDYSDRIVCILTEKEINLLRKPR